MKTSLKQLKKDFELFKENIPINLDLMRSLLSLEKLNYSFREIENSYEVYYSNYKNPGKIGLTTLKLEDIIYTYWGEAFKHYQGGKWVLNLTKRDEAFGSPTIENWGGDNYPWSRISPKVWKIRIEKFGPNDMKPAKQVFGD